MMKAYKSHHEPKNLLTSPEALDDPETQSIHIEFYGYSKDDFARDKALALRHQEFIMRIRSSYKDVKNVLDSCDRNALRKIDFNNLPTGMRHPQDNSDVENILKYALAVFYYHSFARKGIKGNIQDETIVDASSYYSYLNHLQPKYLSLLKDKGKEVIHRLQLEYLFRLQVELDAIRKKNCAIKAQTLLELQLDPSLLDLEFTGHFSRYLRGATFYCKDFEELLQDDSSNRIYYLDSPYFLTVGYDVGFFDDKHIKMLDLLRDAKFKWIFSMQYNLSTMKTCTTNSDKKSVKVSRIS